MPKLQKDSLTSVFVFVDAAVTVPQLCVFAPAGIFPCDSKPEEPIPWDEKRRLSEASGIVNVSKLTGRLSRLFCCVDFQRVFLGILESASFRGAKSGMLRENGKGNPARVSLN